MPQWALQQKVRGGWAVLEVVGEVDLDTVPSLRSCLDRMILELAVPRIVVDLSAVSFLGAAGVGALVGARRAARAAAGEVRLAGARPSVRRVLDITGATAAIVTAASVPEAMAAG